MEAKVQRWVQRHGWDRAATCYERCWQAQLQPVTDLVLRLAALRSGEHVIDVACGTGSVTIPAALAVGTSGRVLGTDLSPGMVAELERHAHACGLTNVDVETVGAEELGHDARFDVGLCSLGWMYVPDPPAAARQLVQALRPGGRAVVAVWGERDQCGWSEVFPIVDARVSSDVCPRFFALGAPGALAGLLVGAGFVDVDDTRLDVELSYDHDEAALGAAFAGGPVALAWSRFDDDQRRSAAGEYLASIARFAGPDGYRLPGQFVVATGRRRSTPDTKEITKSTKGSQHRDHH